MDKKVKQASKIIKSGGIVSFPTETVYALAADINNKNAINSIYDLKGRDENKPLALLIEDISFLEGMVEIDDIAKKLINEFCPGPITFILNKDKDCNLPEFLNPTTDTIAIRIPDNEVAIAIVKEAGGAIAATSVNPSGKDPATSYEEVNEYFGDKIDYVIDGGKSKISVSSTILDLTSDDLKILRQGSITKADLDRVLK